MKNKNKKANLFLFTILLLAGFFGFWRSGKTTDNKILITEIMYSPPGSDSGREWIEIYNISNEVINISHDLLGLIDEIEEHDESGKLKNTCHTFNLDLEINPREFIVIADNESLFIQDYPDYSGKILDSVASLLNGEDTVKISFDRCKTWEAQTSYSSTWGADGNGKTLEKIKLTDDNNKENWQESYEFKGTPGAESSKRKEYSKEIRINELFPAPQNSDVEEFIELYNSGPDNINLDGWRLEDKGGTKCNLSEIIEADEKNRYVIFQEGKDCKIALNDTREEEIYLYNPQDEEPVSVAGYDKKPEEDKSWSYKDSENKWKWTSIWTPGEENKFDEDVEYPEGITINEIFPNPLGEEKEKEFIELFNTTKEKIDISRWMLKDSAKSSKYIFPQETSVDPRGFLVIYREKFDFALNNSSGESVYFIDPGGKEVSKVSYDKANEGVSYNFDGKNWRWSKDITPGKENKFNKLPKIEVDMDDKIYVDIYADFEVKVNDPEKEKVKVTWDFGDGHKSYKKETRHKYEEKGKYKLSVKIFDGSEEVIKEYKIEAKKFSHKEVKIRALCPNPAGDDSENEWILVKNYSDDEINLKGWSVATGSKKLYNHPIYEDIEIKKGKTGKIIREDSNFTLNNEKSKVELRYPDGKEAYQVKYDKGDDNTAEEDEVYEKTDDGWRWVKTQTNPVKFAEADHGAGADETQTNVDTTQAGAEETEEEDFSEFLGGWSEDESDKISRDELLNYGTQIKLAVAVYSGKGKVLGASTENYNEPIYHFTKSSPGEHYAAKFFKKILLNINYFINKVFLMFP